MALFFGPELALWLLWSLARSTDQDTATILCRLLPQPRIDIYIVADTVW
jgi:hypothetical protein